MSRILGALFLVLLACGSANAAILVLSPNGRYKQVATLEVARTSPDIADKTVVVTSPLTRTQSNIMGTWPADRMLRVDKGGSIANSTAFAFAKGGVTEVTPDWWAGSDTQRLQSAIDSGASRVVIHSDMRVSNIVISRKNDLEIICRKNARIASSLAPGADTFAPTHQNTANLQIFYVSASSNITFEVNLVNHYEGFYLYASSDITIRNSSIEGTAGNTFPSIIAYQCTNIKVLDSHIFNNGSIRTVASALGYGSGTGIRLIYCVGFHVQRCQINNNGENGILMWRSADGWIQDNSIHDNSLSGIQIGFSGLNVEKNYIISGNLIYNNMADGIDVNNASGSAAFDINAVIENNTSYNNGFSGGARTPDGSGIGTLIHVNNVRVIGNKTYDTNKASVYLYDASDIIIRDNSAVRVQLEGGRNDNVTIEGNSLAWVDFSSGTACGTITIRNNKISKGMIIPNATSIRMLNILDNTLALSGAINLNLLDSLKPSVNIRGNHFVANSDYRDGTNTLIYNSTNYVVFDGNTFDHGSITTMQHAVLTSGANIFGTKVINNTFKHFNAGFTSFGKNETIENNRFIGTNGKPYGTRSIQILAGTTHNTTIANNTIAGDPASNAIYIDATGSINIDNNYIVSGNNKLGTVSVKTSWH
ncbi:MAG: right-handed parallel beta-helix repeat-containing protein [Desulfuromonadales bacterium]